MAENLASIPPLAGNADKPNYHALRRGLADAFNKGTTRSLEWRRQQLGAVQRLFTERESEFLEAMRADLNKPAQEAWMAEVGMCANDARYALKKLARWTAPRKVSTPALAMPGKSWIQPEPLGVVLIIGAWNYPVQLMFSPLIAAIAAGNCAVLKPSELAPATSAAIAKWVPQYLDRECFKVVEGEIPETTALLDEAWDHILYTGGGNVGKIVMTAAARHLTPVTLELGGKSPCIVLPDANLETTARRLCWGKFMNAGQTCIAPDYLLTDEATEKKLLPLLNKAIKEMYGDDPAASDSFARIVNERHTRRLAELIESGTVAIGGQVDVDNRYIAPTVLTGVSRDSAVMKGEIFGPILPVVRISGLEDALSFVRHGEKPLASYLFTTSKESERRFTEEISSGSAGINDVLMFHAVPELPFGGVGASGMGCYSGEHGFRTFSHFKAVLKRSWWPDVRLRYAPYTQKALKLLKRLA